jgi:hypothetical protein
MISANEIKLCSFRCMRFVRLSRNDKACALFEPNVTQRKADFYLDVLPKIMFPAFTRDADVYGFPENPDFCRRVQSRLARFLSRRDRAPACCPA